MSAKTLRRDKRERAQTRVAALLVAAHASRDAAAVALGRLAESIAAGAKEGQR